MRLFIAIPVPPDVSRALAAAQQQVKQVSAGGRYVSAENFHLTMHFIGESDDLAGAAAACEEAVRGLRPFLVRLERFGRFMRNGAYTATVLLAGDLQELRSLYETLTSALRERGFSSTGGQKRFAPHITLARDVRTAEDAEDHYDTLRLETGAGSAFTANLLVLYESRNVGGRMVYTPLHKTRLFQD